MAYFDGYGNPVDFPTTARRGNAFKTSIHRGYPETYYDENTLNACRRAYEAGYDYAEIDVCRCADGVYILSHGTTATLYNNGAAVSVTFADVNYSDIKDYTLDSGGTCRITTLACVLNYAKALDFGYFVEVKNGSRAEVLALASKCCVLDKVLLIYQTTSGALDDTEVLNQYSQVPLIVQPVGSFSDIKSLKAAVHNTIYMNVGASNNMTYLPIALAADLPILFWNATADNAPAWQVLASMVQVVAGDFKPDDVRTCLDVDYNVSCNITTDLQEQELTRLTEYTFTASTDVDTPAGYLYAYTLDTDVCGISQTGYGNSIRFTLRGLNVGSTTVRLLTGNGAFKDIPVTIVAAS